MFKKSHWLVLALSVLSIGCGGSKEFTVEVAPEERKAMEEREAMERKMMQQNRQQTEMMQGQSSAAQPPAQQQ